MQFNLNEDVLNTADENELIEYNHFRGDEVTITAYKSIPDKYEPDNLEIIDGDLLEVLYLLSLRGLLDSLKNGD